MTPQGRLLALVAIIGIPVMVTLSVANAPLRTDAAPLGIISLELAGDRETAAAIIGSWGPRQREAASFGLGLDFLFLLLYPLGLSLAVSLTATRAIRWSPRVALWGKIIALSLPIAAVLDAIENAALWRMLQLGPSGVWPGVAAVVASAKFALVGIGVVYLVVTMLGTPRQQPRSDST